MASSTSVERDEARFSGAGSCSEWRRRSKTAAAQIINAGDVQRATQASKATVTARVSDAGRKRRVAQASRATAAARFGSAS